MNHGLETKVDFAGADNLRDILGTVSGGLLVKPSSTSYAGVVGLEKSNLDALFLEETFGLSQVERCVVRRSVPACARVSRSNPGTGPCE